MNNSVMSTYQRLPVAFESGDGAWLIDTDGNRYLDALSGISVCNLGHANPVIAQAIAAQAGRLVHTSNLYEIPIQAQLARKLCDLSGLDSAFFCNSGAEANEAAIKMCRKYGHDKNMQVPVIVVMEGSFHGRTLATLSATGNSKIHTGFTPLVSGFHRIPYNDINALRQLSDSDLEICAVMLEPVQGEGGVLVPAAGYLRTVRDVCTEHDWLMVLDEVQTGMCRTGKWFAAQHEQVLPDVMTLAKALGNGLPIGACLAVDKVAGLMVPGSHGSTFGGNPLAAYTALAVIKYMEEHHLADRTAEMGSLMLSHLTEALGHENAVRDIRGKGLMIGIELDMKCTELVNMALQCRLLINVTADNVVRLLPPLTISNEEMEQITGTVIKLIHNFAGQTS